MQIFSPSQLFVKALLIGSFVEKIFEIFMKPSILILSLWVILFIKSKKLLLSPRSQEFSPIFLKFYILHINVCSVLSYFLYKIWRLAGDSFFLSRCPVFRYHLLTSFIVLPLKFVKSMLNLLSGLIFLCSLFCSINLCVYPSTNATQSWLL